jgi:hypothetical protein
VAPSEAVKRNKSQVKCFNCGKKGETRAHHQKSSDIAPITRLLCPSPACDSQATAARTARALRVLRRATIAAQANIRAKNVQTRQPASTRARRNATTAGNWATLLPRVQRACLPLQHAISAGKRGTSLASAPARPIRRHSRARRTRPPSKPRRRVGRKPASAKTMKRLTASVQSCSLSASIRTSRQRRRRLLNGLRRPCNDKPHVTRE